MSLRRKTFLVIGLTLVGLVSALYAASVAIVLAGFERVEREMAYHNAHRALDAHREVLTRLEATTSDWAFWTDTGNWLQGKDPGYVAKNLGNGPIQVLKLNVLAFARPSGELFYGTGFDPRTGTKRPLPREIREHLKQPVFQGLRGRSDCRSGLLVLRDALVLCAARPILTSNAQGPSRGILLFAQNLDQEAIRRLAGVTHLTLSLQRLDGPLSPDFAAARGALETGDEVQVRTLSSEYIAGYTLLRDIYNRPAAIMKVTVPREIHRQGEQTLSYFLASLLLSGLVFGAVTILLLERSVLSRVARLRAGVRGIAETRDPEARLPSFGDDELGDLATAITGMVNVIRAGEQVLRSFVEHNPAAVAMVDTEMRYLVASRRWLQDYRLGDRDLSGLSHYEVFPEIGADWKAIHRRCMAGAVERREEDPFFRSDGTLDWVKWEIRPWLRPDGAIGGIIMFTEVITARREAEQRLRRAQQSYKRLLDTSAEGVWVADRHGVASYVNRRMGELLGCAPEGLVGRSLFDFLSPDEVERARKHLSQPDLERGADFPLLRQDDSHLWVHVSVSRIPDEDGQVSGVLCMFTDISARKAAEQALQRAKETAEAAARAKSEFLANMSHEIRTPMNGIIGMTELTLDTELDPEQRENLELVRDSARSLLKIINDILDFSRVEAGKLELEQAAFDPRECVEETLRTFRLAAGQKGVLLESEFSEDLPPQAVGDSGRLRQVLVNLVGNALKFTAEGTVSVRVQPQAAGALLFTVRDTGIGIPPEKQSLIFEAFAQADASTTRRYGGTGLGLAISTRLVHLMGGRIWLESRPGQGSAFFFTLPLAPAEEAPPPPPVPAPSSPVRPLRVLLAEDNPVSQRVAARVLEKRGHHVAVVGDGRQAAARAAEEPFDVLLLDVQMPEMSGFQVAHAIRDAEARLPQPLRTRLPILGLTAHALQGDRERCLEAGMDAYLCKPFQAQDLVACVERLAGEGGNEGRRE